MKHDVGVAIGFGLGAVPHERGSEGEVAGVHTFIVGTS